MTDKQRKVFEDVLKEPHRDGLYVARIGLNFNPKCSDDDGMYEVSENPCKMLSDKPYIPTKNGIAETAEFYGEIQRKRIINRLIVAYGSESEIDLRMMVVCDARIPSEETIYVFEKIDDEER